MTTLLITIDTEHFTQAPSPVVPYPGGAWCTVRDRHYGFPLIMDLCDNYAIKVTFFINVFEYKVIGQAVMAQMCQEIVKRGHDVQLHTHPAFLTGRQLLCDHSLEEQRELIGIGKQKLYEWTTREVVAHRAGYYGVNDTSLEALKDCGIRLDCSSFYEREGCGVHWNRFELDERNGMWELPISWFRIVKNVGAGNRGGGRIRKVDIDKASADYLIAFLRRAIEEGYGHITLASHSFSFIRHSKSGNAFTFDEQKVREFERLLLFVASTDELQTQSVAELWEDIESARIRLKPDGNEVCLAEA